MVHAYHLILPMYGFWLPNDPRGSWSDLVRQWEIARFGRPIKTLERRRLDELTKAEAIAREAAKRALRYPAVSITLEQARTIAAGFAELCAKSNYAIWACSILPEHTHMVLGRHRYKVEQIANLLKGAATTAMLKAQNHPLARFAEVGKRPPRMWSAQQWKQYLDHETAIEQAIHYVEENPDREGLPRQNWSFVSQFTGIDLSGWTTYT